MALTLARNNDNLLTLERVIDFISGPISDMEGTITVYDQKDNVVLEGCDSLPITFTTTWDGKEIYYVVIGQEVPITDGTVYRGLFRSSNYGVEREVKLTGKRMLIE